MPFSLNFTPSEPLPVALVGATGTVGQKLLALSLHTPWLRIVEVAASQERVGKVLGETCPWREILPLPEALGKMPLSSMDTLTAPYILSCLPSEVAAAYEGAWAERGHHVFSNASFFRMNPSVPLLVPEINATHLSLLDQQSTGGKIITNPNCSAVGIALALAPILRHKKPRHLSIVTLQSLSGAGYPGVASLDILGNTIPHIPGEAEKIEGELKKIWGTAHEALDIAITVSVHRVPVLYGHSATVHLMFDQPLGIGEVRDLYHQWNRELPQELFVCHALPEEPQPRRHLRQDDMRIHLGPLSHGADGRMLRFHILSHNLVRGAAGAVLANLKCFLES